MCRRSEAIKRRILEIVKKAFNQISNQTARAHWVITRAIMCIRLREKFLLASGSIVLAGCYYSHALLDRGRNHCLFWKVWFVFTTTVLVADRPCLVTPVFLPQSSSYMVKHAQRSCLGNEMDSCFLEQQRPRLFSFEATLAASTWLCLCHCAAGQQVALDCALHLMIRAQDAPVVCTVATDDATLTSPNIRLQVFPSTIWLYSLFSLLSST